jgi:hypothetical protein
MGHSPRLRLESGSLPRGDRPQIYRSGAACRRALAVARRPPRGGVDGGPPPDLDELRAALADRELVLILDELERGINSIPDTARRNQNLSFLQMLSEEASRNRQITIFAAIYDGNIERGSTLKRVPRIELRFRKPEDRASIVRHRLFANSDSYDKDAARTPVRSYLNTWRRFGVQPTEAYVQRMEPSFPFLPELIDLLFERVPQTGGFQGTRSALGLMGAMLDAGGEGAYLMTAAHCRLTDKACADRLQDLDPDRPTAEGSSASTSLSAGVVII